MLMSAVKEALQRLRVRSPTRLTDYEHRVFSQNGEDGIIQEIFHRIGITNRYFVEFGVEGGIECNCGRLVKMKGWSGLFMEADPAHFAQLEENYEPYPNVTCRQAMVASSNIEEIFSKNGVPLEPDLLSIDIDGNDYWVWAAIKRWSPRVVIVEYNASHRPPRRWVMKEDPDHTWDQTNYYGASLASLAALGEQKGYALVATDSMGVNAFFVRRELAVPERFIRPGDVMFHYSPPRFGSYEGGHRAGSGPYVEI
jgi:hypothetical protein